MTRIGLISDTHGLLRPQASAFLQGCDAIIHGGDIGDPAILDALAAIAPLTVVRGNNDKGAWAAAIPETALLRVGQVTICVIHDIGELARLGMDPAAAGARVVVSGHSHRPSVAQRDGALYVNPGSAGRRRFTLPVAVAELLIDGGAVQARIVELDIGLPPAG
jgi:putative phosphoesterase